MPASTPPTPTAPDEPSGDRGLPLVVIHHITVLDPSKGWRVTVRITDGWQGKTLSHWSRGGSSVAHGEHKVIGDLEVAYGEALEALTPFP